ncbi:hypothetical protein [Gordonia sp. NPDC003429]
MAAQVPRQQLPFAVVMRGYDREQVADTMRRFDAEMRVLAADRDAATANAHELAAHLQGARDQIEDLRREVDTLSVPPTTAQGMSERLSRMLQLASDESSEMRAEASAEAAETLSVARQEAAQLVSDSHAEADRILAEARHRAAGIVAEAEEKATELRDEADAVNAKSKADAAEDDRLRDERRAAMEAEHTKTMTAAREEAQRMVAKAQAEAAELERESAQTRAEMQRQHEADLADQRRVALGEAQNIRQTAREIATERLARSREMAARADEARAGVLAEFEEIRTKLSDFPDILRRPGDVDYTAMSDADDLDELNRVLSERSRVGAED